MSVVEKRSLTPGLKVGHYEITAFVGAGGMGEVYSAIDQRLSRRVALKILPAEYGGNEERIRRFEIEARAVGQLNHPNIVSIFDVGEYDSRPYIVTEFLEGATLRTNVQENGPLPVRRAIEIAIQIARGLAAAHDKGIIHRDLKPANIFVSKDDHVKVLDFGLAKLTQTAHGHDGGDATISGVTVPGSVFGSAGYMSPEQVEALAVDSRTDIFSFGAILFEMLAGKRAFEGNSIPATISAILKDEPPDLSLLRPAVPPELARVVRRCLEKLPEARYQSARDLAFSLEELHARSEVTFSSAAAFMIRRGVVKLGRPRAIGLASLLVAAVAVVMFVNANSRSGAATAEAEAARPRLRLTRLTSTGTVDNTVAVSPDGRYVVMASSPEGISTLALMHVPTKSSTVLARGGTFGRARFSPDGNLIYYIAYDKERADIFRMPLLGGTPQVIARDVNLGSLSFTPDGAEIAFVRDVNNGDELALWVSAADGSNARKVTQGKYLECTMGPTRGKALCLAYSPYAIMEVDLQTGGRRRLQIPPVIQAHPLPDGHSIVGCTDYASGNQIVKIDLRSGATSALTNDLSHYQPLDLTNDGTTIAAGRIDMRTNLWRVSVDDPAALKQITSGTNTFDGNFGVTAPSANQIVWASNAATSSIDLWISDRDGRGARRLTLEDDSDEKWPASSPDGKYVAYTRILKERHDIWRVSVSGTEPPLQLTTTGDAGGPHFSDDGRSIVYERLIDGKTFAWEVPVEGGEPQQLLDEPVHGPMPSPSGDGLLVGVETPEGTKLELRPFHGRGERRDLHLPGVIRKWRPDGRAFAFLKESNGSMNLWLQKLDGSAPRAITNFAQRDFIAWGFDWTPDGKEIVFARRTNTMDVVLLQGIQ